MKCFFKLFKGNFPPLGRRNIKLFFNPLKPLRIGRRTGKYIVIGIVIYNDLYRYRA